MSVYFILFGPILHIDLLDLSIDLFFFWFLYPLLLTAAQLRALDFKIGAERGHWVRQHRPLVDFTPATCVWGRAFAAR